MKWVEGRDGVWRPERPGQRNGPSLPAWLPAAIAIGALVVTVLVRWGR